MTRPAEFLSRFDLLPADARLAQSKIPPLVERKDRFEKIRTVAGADIALEGNKGYAAVIVYSFPQLQELERAWSTGELKFPYVPGLLAFRELPLLLETFSKLRQTPELVLADAHGWAHPRRAGMACHLGLVLDTPTIGCAKSLLVGEYAMPHAARGSTAALRDGRERIGTVLRTRDEVRPVFVSCGHRVSLATAVRLVMQCCDGYRIPKPQREADHWVKELKRQTRLS
ncbi:MAG: endonuclease V [Acidobacteria bacterium]|nr:endonuclease V [Acidobacteriota bacterium]